MGRNLPEGAELAHSMASQFVSAPQNSAMREPPHGRWFKLPALDKKWRTENMTAEPLALASEIRDENAWRDTIKTAADEQEPVVR